MESLFGKTTKQNTELGRDCENKIEESNTNDIGNYNSEQREINLSIPDNVNSDRFTFSRTIEKRKSVTGIEVFEIINNKPLTSPIFNSRPKTHRHQRSLSLDSIDSSIENVESLKVNTQNDSHSESNTPTSSPNNLSTNDDLNKLIDTKLRKMKDKMLLNLKKYNRELEQKYGEHIERVKSNVVQKAIRITEVFNKNIRSNSTFSRKKFSTNETSSSGASSPKKELEYMLNYTCKNVGEKLDQVFDIHEKIESSLEKNMEILYNFLDNFDIFQDNPLQNFVNSNPDDIMNSWIFSKINFEKINLINLLENDKIPNNLKNFIFQDTVNKFSMISIKKSKNYDFERKLMFDNHLILEKLSLKNLDQGEFHKIFSKLIHIEGMQFRKLKEIIISDCLLDSIIFHLLFPNVEKVLMKNCLIRTSFFGNIAKDFSKLKNLTITCSNLNNKTLSNLLEDFAKTQELLENLQILNLSNNKITQFDLSALSNVNKKLYSLEVLLLSKNKLYKFKSMNLSYMPNIRMINLSSNNFTSGKDFVDIKGKAKKLNFCLYVILNKNMFMINDESQNIEYVQYLIETLPNFDFFLRKLDLSYIFNIFNKSEILNLNLNSNIQISLKKLDLSYCSLDTNIVASFIKNNSGFINLRLLNLSFNNIDDTFLDLYIKENYFNLLENLEVINFTSNKITQKSCLNIENLLKYQQKIEKVILNNNIIEDSVIQYLNLHLDKFEAEKIKNEQSEFEIKLHEFNDPTLRVNNIGDFFDNLLDLKKKFKILFSKRVEKFFNQFSYSGFSSKKKWELHKVLVFENK